MPGICGIVAPGSGEERTRLLQRMSQHLTGGPNAQTGIEDEPGLDFGLAWKTGLGAFRGCLPAWNRDRTVCLLLAGEVFGIGAAREGGSHAEGDSTARVRACLQAYDQQGWAFLEELNGWFGGVLVDLRQRCVAAFTDRYGLGRLYYHESPRGFLFASEAKSLLAVKAELRGLDGRSLGEWLSCGCALQHRTLFAGVELLPPGTVWVVSGAARSKRRYFECGVWESQPTLAMPEYHERLREVFPRILRRYLEGAESLAMSLTGGLDGRMIMSWSGRPAGQLPCYTFDGPFRECADARIARRIAEACRQPHRIISVGDSFLRQFPGLAEESVFVSDGAMDVTGAVEVYVNRLARQIAPVRVTGNYGSEILRRYVAFGPRSFSGELLSPALQEHMLAAAKTYAAESGGNRLSFIVSKQMPWHHFARFAVERVEVGVRSPFLDNELVALAFQAPAAGAGLETCLSLISEGNPALGQIPTDRGVTYPSSEVSARCRRVVAEFLAKAEYAYDYGMPDWLVRVDRWLGGLRLERLFLGRQKFCHFRYWYRHQLGPYVKQVLLDPRSLARPYLNRVAVERMVSAHLAGRENWTVAIHKLLSLELLHRSVLERG